MLTDAELYRELIDTLQTKHFLLHYQLRNPPDGKGLARDGVSDLALLQHYAKALEDLYDKITSAPYLRQKLGLEGQDLINVYILDTLQILQGDGAFMDVNLQGIPYIALPSCHHEPTNNAMFTCAAAQAVHEAVHVFNQRERPLRDRQTGFPEFSSIPWRWFDEAMATYMEAQILPENPDYLRYMVNWSNQPEIPLDDERAHYQAGMFAHYLENRLGPGFVSRVWTQASKPETPFVALNRLLQEQGMTFVSSDPQVSDLFASGYCMDAYFLADPVVGGFARAVYQRYGERAVRYSWEIDAHCSIPFSDTLDHLACRYYRLFVTKTVNTLQVQIAIEGAKATPVFKAEIAAVLRDGRRGVVTPLQRFAQMDGSDRILLGVELADQPLHSIDHFVLVVTNCGLRKEQRNIRLPHDDQQKYTLQIGAW